MDMRLDQLEERMANIQLSRRPVAGPVNKTTERIQGTKERTKVARPTQSADLRRRKMEGKMSCLKKKEKTVETVLTEEEKDLWENSTWRNQIKDLNESFSKLPPIFEGNKCGRKSRAFVVKIDQQ